MVKIIAGLMGSSAASGSKSLSTPDQLRGLLGVIQSFGVQDIDTARVYNGGQSERDLGAVPEAQKSFAIATKAPGFSPGSLTAEKVLNNCNASLEALRQDRIDLYYFHGPDRQTPLEDSCRAIHQLHQDGKIANFGVSNFNASEVAEMHDICARNGWITPSVYQGGYSPLARTGEKELFPTLRRLNMAFYAYSPLAGGFFAKTAAQLRDPDSKGRMSEMPIFKSMFVNDLSLSLLEDLTQTCRNANLTVLQATLRWLLHHSALGEQDGIILGAASREQMEGSLQASQGGPLPVEVADAFEALWKRWSEAGKAPPASL